MPASSQVLAADPLLGRSAVRLGGGRVLAVGVALVADGPTIALGLLRVVAAHEHRVEHLGLTVLIVGADEVAGLAAGDTVPVLATVELVGEVSVAHGGAVDLVVRGRAVLGGAGGGGRGRTVHGVVTGSVSTVHIIGVGAPVVVSIILLVIGTGLSGHTTLDKS